MDQTHRVNVRVRGRRYAVNFPSLGIGFVLAAISGWHLPSVILDDPSTLQRIFTSVVFPLSIISGVATLEFSRLAATSKPPLAFKQRSLGPFGSSATGYILPDRPADEFQHELRGLLALPLTTAFTAILVLISPAESTIRLTLLTLSGSHLLILLINLMPAYPFTGGAIFRSIFWHLHGNAMSGTRATFLYGQFIAAAVVGLGLYFLTWETSLLVPGLWGIFAGVLIIYSSRNELRRVHVIKRAADIEAADSIEGLNPTIRAAAPLTEAIEILMEQRSNGPGLVRDRVEFTGMITLDRIRKVPRSDWSNLTTAEVSVPFTSLMEAAAGASLLEVLHTLTEHETTTIIVRRGNGRIIGLIDQTVDPRLLVRRGLMRNLETALSARTPHGGPKTS